MQVIVIRDTTTELNHNENKRTFFESFSKRNKLKKMKSKLQLHWQIIICMVFGTILGSYFNQINFTNNGLLYIYSFTWRYFC